MAIFRGNVLLQVLGKLDQTLGKTFGVSEIKTCAHRQENTRSSDLDVEIDLCKIKVSLECNRLLCGKGLEKSNGKPG